jgi:hypothetical protein
VKVPLLRPVVPPHVFCLLADGVTYARVRREEPVGFAEARSFAYPANALGSSPTGTPLFTREALSEAVTTARRLTDGRLSRASVVFPDSWARILSIDFDSLPATREAVREMVLWKLKKLLPGVTSELAATFREMPRDGGEAQGRRLLVAAAPVESIRSIEEGFESLGVRVGVLAPASLVLFEGMAPALSARSRGDYGLLHRTPDAFCLVIARDRAPLFFRQRPAEEQQGPGLAAVYVHDEIGGRDLAETAVFPVPPVPLSGEIFGADAGFDERIAARPELLSAFAAVWGRN